MKMPQRLTYGTHKLAPSLGPTATLITSSLRCSPLNDEIGNKRNQLALCDVAASKQAWLRSSDWEAISAIQESYLLAPLTTGFGKGWKDTVQRSKYQSN